MRRAFVVDDEAPVRNGLAALLDPARGYVTVACCATAATACTFLARGHAFVVAITVMLA